MDLSALQRLAAPCCGRPHDLLVLLDHVSDVAPTGPWALLRCPGCGAAACLELAGEHAALGRLREERGAHFEPHMRVRQPGLRVRGFPAGMEVELLHRRWVFERRR
ncbi:MAG TPA: hypothetical protein VNE71_01795 [Myxococcota bacterium]|nr:hypothetical protein [Myxococcota bacterium]